MQSCRRAVQEQREQFAQQVSLLKQQDLKLQALDERCRRIRWALADRA